MSRHDEEHLYVEKYRNGGGGGGSAAEDITYDDSTTHINATNVQEAIEKLDAVDDNTIQQIEIIMSRFENLVSYNSETEAITIS